jgi:hypothetical protein
MLGSNPGQLRLRYWLSDALTTRLDLIHIHKISHIIKLHKYNTSNNFIFYRNIFSSRTKNWCFRNF